MNDNANVSVVEYKERLVSGVHKITFKTENCGFTCPGQYTEIRVDGCFRPYQVCDFDSRRFTVIAYDDRDDCKLSGLDFGQSVETVTGLGSGFDLETVPEAGIVLVADSTGISDMLELARSLLIRGKSFRTVLGYANKEEIYMVDSFRNVCNELEVLTLDGSNGREGAPEDAVRNAAYVCASGSPKMLKKLALNAEDGQFSFSSVMLRQQIHVPGSKGMVVLRDEEARLCSKEGPVFAKSEINWELI